MRLSIFISPKFEWNIFKNYACILINNEFGFFRNQHSTLSHYSFNYNLSNFWDVLLLNANAHTVNTQLMRYCNLPLGIADTQFSATIAPKTIKTWGICKPAIFCKWQKWKYKINNLIWEQEARRRTGQEAEKETTHWRRESPSVLEETVTSQGSISWTRARIWINTGQSCLHFVSTYLC